MIDLFQVLADADDLSAREFRDKYPQAGSASGLLVWLVKEVREERLRRAAQAVRFASYEVPRPADEPHDARCQVARCGPRHACTCASNSTRRRLMIENAARADDLDFRDTLGSMEQHQFDAARSGEAK